MSYTKQLQYFKRALVSWNGGRFYQTVKGISFNYWKTVSKVINPLSANFTKWSNTLKQFVGKLATNCLSVLDRFVGLALKELTRDS